MTGGKCSIGKGCLEDADVFKVVVFEPALLVEGVEVAVGIEVEAEACVEVGSE
jgi:hypothetical protein